MRSESGEKMSSATHTPRVRGLGRGDGRTQSRYRKTPGALRTGEVLVLVLVALALVWSALASRTPQPSSVPTVTTRVVQGQTLWQIARANPVPGLSTAQTADLIAEINDLESGAVTVGTLVQVPAQASGVAALASR